MWNNWLVSSTLFATALSLPASHVLHEKRSSPSPGRRQRVDAEAIIPVRFGLRQSNLHTGYERLMAVSHPDSPDYGKHLSAEEVHSIFAPAEETVEVVKSWLLGSGLTNETDIIGYENKGWLAVDMPVKILETLLRTEYHEHELSDGTLKIGCDEYYLPAHVSPHIDFIKPGVKLSAPLKKRNLAKRSELKELRQGHYRPHIDPPRYPDWQMPPSAHGLDPDLRSCGVNITPACIKSLYQIPTAKFSSPENVMGLYETYDSFSVGDIDLFFQNYAPNVPQGTVPDVISVDGATAPVSPSSIRNGGESDIDIDLSVSLIYPQRVTVYEVDDLPNSSGETNVTGFLNTFLDSIDGSYCDYSAFGITGDSTGVDAQYPDVSGLPGAYTGPLECGTYNLTRVVSISYGEAEIDLPKAYVERQCNEIMKLGLQGHSILVASGDYGVASFPGSNDNAEGCLSGFGQNGTIYNPDYPSGCPYITAVGATRLYPDDTVKDPESAMQVNLTAFNLATGTGPITTPYDFFATGGGFSNYFTPPSYQASAVSAYLAKDLPFQSLPYYTVNDDASNIGENGGVYNRIGRGYPDVSANGAFLLTFVNLTMGTYFGTSLASPIFGAVITLINEERTSVGKGPIGFINPALYANPSILNDITNGSNPNCGSQGFQTSTGWDPVTGLGTPNYPKMLEYFMSLP